MLASSLQRSCPHLVPPSADIFWALFLHVDRPMGSGAWAGATRHAFSESTADWLDLPAVRLQADCKAFCSKLLIQGMIDVDC